MNASLTAGRVIAVELGRSYPSVDRNRLQALSRRMLGILDERGLRTLLIDMSQTEDFGAGLIGVLARVIRHADIKGQEVVICGVNEEASKLFRMTRLDREWPIYESRAVALKERGNPRVNITVAA
jgi:anti-anti-sigma factor